jgi:uncharacterized protein YicC (UPF0701 family)
MERVRDARMEQIDEQATEKTPIVEQRQAARENYIEHNADLAKANVAKAEGSSQSMSDDALDMSKESALYEAKARGRVETIAVRIDAARKMLGALNGKAPTDARAQLDALEGVQELMQTEVHELTITPDANWNAKKQGVDVEITRLNQRVDAFTNQLESI